MATIWVLCRTKTYFCRALSTVIASPGSSDQMTERDRRSGPLWVSDRIMMRHDLLGLQVSKLAFLFKWSRSSQHGAHRRVLGCFWKGGGSAKNTCIKKISKQKHLWKVITLKRKRFRQVKIINPFPLNKMIATSITKLPKEA